MCCLGFCALQLGASEPAIRLYAEPKELAGAVGIINEVVVCTNGEGIDEEYVVNTELASRAMSVNDDAFITDAVREAALRSIFAQYGHTIEFR